MRCTVCDKDKEINQFQTYWHSTQQKMRTRKQCTECLYNIRLKNHNPEKYYQNNPDYKKCNTCSEWKLAATEYYHKNGRPYMNRCKECELTLERNRRKEYLMENCGSEKVSPKPNHYADEYQKACTFYFMEVMGYIYDEPTGIWIKPGYKEIRDGKIIFPTLNLKAITRKKISPTKLERILGLREQGLSYEKIAEQLGISDTSVYKYIKKWKSQLK
jgi:hypothetical protein